MIAEHDTQISTNYRLFNVKELMINRLFLVDADAEVCVSPRDLNNLTAAQAGKLRAANGTGIQTYRHRSPTLDLGLGCTLCWVFIVADVT